MLVEFECPECKGHICERWGLNGSNIGIRLGYWHLVLNPGLAFNELILGQRTPQQVFICKSCALPMADRSYVHCPSCGVFHAGRIWSYRNAFGNWLGYVCPACGAQIPCLWNLTSRVLLLLTAPIWWLPIRLNKEKLIAQQHQRVTQTSTAYIDKTSNTRKPINYQLMGLHFGLFMDLFFAAHMVFVASGRGTSGWWALVGTYFVWAVVGLIFWLPGGWLFALAMKLILEKKGDPDLHLSFDSDGAIVPHSISPQIGDQEKEDNPSR
jgi:predicted RNA-binding Zn-ribbon protein involved in translation (DUF1610 family)